MAVNLPTEACFLKKTTGETPVAPKQIFETIASSESRHERITDRDGESGNIRAIELHVVVDQVVVNFRPDEGIPPEVITKIGAEVSCKMVTAHVIGAACKVTVELGVEPQILAPNSSHHVAAEFLAKFATVNGIEIIKDRTIGRRSEKGGTAFCIEPPTCSPCNFAAEAEVVLQNKEAAEAGIQTSADRRKGIAVAVRRCSRAVDRAEPERSVKFLSLRAERKQECHCENTNC